MATATARLGLIKQDLGENPAAWHTNLNYSLDRIDHFVGLSIEGDPNTIGITAYFPGQRVFQRNAAAWWVVGPEGPPVYGKWVREIPRGLISPYSGSVASIPFGWLLCDGQAVEIDGETVQTPDLRGRFIVGHDPNDPNFNAAPDPITADKKGGNKTHLLAQNQLPNVTLETSVNNPPVTIEVGFSNRDFGGTNVYAPGTGVILTAPDHTHEFVLNPGNQEPVNHLPPYYTLAYIFKV